MTQKRHCLLTVEPSRLTTSRELLFPLSDYLSKTANVFSQSLKVGASRKLPPPLISDRDHFWGLFLPMFFEPLISNRLMHGLISMFVVYTLPLTVYKEVLATT